MATFGKDLLVWLTVCFHCIMSISNFDCFLFCVLGGTVVLIVSVPGHCLPFALDAMTAIFIRLFFVYISCILKFVAV